MFVFSLVVVGLTSLCTTTRGLSRLLCSGLGLVVLAAANRCAMAIQKMLAPCVMSHSLFGFVYAAAFPQQKTQPLLAQLSTVKA